MTVARIDCRQAHLHPNLLYLLVYFVKILELPNLDFELDYESHVGISTSLPLASRTHILYVELD
jgi:hypothetical protein